MRDLIAGSEAVGVFGATGFIGTQLVRALGAAGIRVIAFGRSFAPNYTSLVGFEVERREINFSDVIATHASIQDVSVVIQLINSSSPSLGNRHVLADLTANVVPHVAFIESCLMSGVRSLIFLSSGGAVYGDPMYLPVDENHPTRPVSSYGLTKVVVEQYIRMLSRDNGMSYFNLRVANPYGPGQYLKKGQGLIASVLQRRASGQPVIVFGDGSTQRDYVYIDDVVDAIIKAAMCEDAKETINIGSGRGRSIIEVIASIEEALATKLNVEYAPGRTSDAASIVLDCSRAKAVLGWEPKTPFAEGIQRTLRFHGF